MNDKALSARIYGLAPQSYEIYFTHCNNHGKISAPLSTRFFHLRLFLIAAARFGEFGGMEASGMSGF